MLSLSEIEKQVAEVNKPLGLNSINFPIFGFRYNDPSFNKDSRGWYVTVEDSEYLLIGLGHYRSKQEETIYVRTRDIDEFIFEIFNHVTRPIADKYISDNNISDNDRRTVLFNKHIEILQSLDLKREFIDRLRTYYDKVLRIESERRNKINKINI